MTCVCFGKQVSVRPFRGFGRLSPMICGPTHAMSWRAFSELPLAPQRIITPMPDVALMKRLWRTVSIPLSCAIDSGRSWAASSLGGAARDSSMHSRISRSKASRVSRLACRSLNDTEKPSYWVMNWLVTRLRSLKNSTATSWL